VFVNLDLGAPPLADYLEGIPDDTAWTHLDEFHCQVTARLPVPCNWKVVSEGFSESYHVQGIHPEMLASVDDLNGPQRIFGLHSVLYQDYGVPSPRLGDVPDATVWESFVRTQGDRVGADRADPEPLPPVPAGSTVREVIAARIRARQAELGIDLSEYDTAALLRLAQYNLFPNASVLVWGDELNVLVALPGDGPGDAELLMYVLHRRPSGNGAPSRKPRDLVIPAGGDVGPVFNQDVAMLQTAQLGLQQPGLTHVTLSAEECRIVNMHRNLEHYLGIEPSELEPLGE
jgi:phenylpropionate dioxygenase-like ring-hydroxylating dioxygenase large terminal subunit